MKYLPHPDYTATKEQVAATIEMYLGDRSYKYMTCFPSGGWFFFNSPRDIIYPITKVEDIPEMVNRETVKIVTKLLTSRLPRNYVPSKATT